MTNFEKVLEFHKAFGAKIAESPELGTIEMQDLRWKLIDEELTELWEAYRSDDIVAVADALGDLLYVVYGAAISHGIPIDDVVTIIHHSNMTKLGEDGKPILRAYDDKIMKGPNYQPPNLRPVLGL